MKFEYALEKGNREKTCFLSTNGLGGYCSLNAEGGVSRCDQGLLISAQRAPDLRITLVHRLREILSAGESSCFLSSQRFSGGQEPEKGTFSRFCWDSLADWQGETWGIQFRRTCSMVWEENGAGVCYEIRNNSDCSCTLTVEPMLKLAPKEEARQTPCPLSLEGNRIRGEQWELFIKTNGQLEQSEPRWERLSYPEDAKDGRPGSGLAGSCCRILFSVEAGREGRLEILFSRNASSASVPAVLAESRDRLLRIQSSCGIQDPAAKQLAAAADAFICRRDSTGGKTILAGYPLFSDWGRDTMIALRGCCLSTGRYADGKSILKTFLQYERRGLLPNLFPEGGREPLYNTADASLLLIDSLWRYYQKTGDLPFLRESFPVMNRILERYCMGTDHGIYMDGDGLIHAGEGLDQVTWMDVRIGDILPTPRHGKPVEINALWYQALKIMENLAPLCGKSPLGYRKLSLLVKEAFQEKFVLPTGLKDVLSGTRADLQIRCNQIFAAALEFSPLEPEQAKRVVETVQTCLFTDHGLRSLSPGDPDYHPFYGGDQRARDLAYHQGTTWVFPLGSFYLAYLKTRGSSEEAARQVRSWLSAIPAMLEEGCAGQLPEIYDGSHPREGKGCYAQAWSAGELLLVYEALETIERKQLQ